MRLSAAVGLSLAAFAAVPVPARAADRPNIVVIFADDLGWGDLACYGHPRFKTPELDRLAAQGARLTNFYVPVPYCAPSRAAILTGRYPARCGMPFNPVPAADGGEKNGDARGLPVAEVTLADLLRKAGYATACVGKWHLGHHEPFLPTRRGFDEYLGVLYSNDMHRVELFDGERMVEYPVVQTTLMRRLTERAVGFIERNRERPFFLYFPTSAVHKPLAPAEAFYKQSGAGLYGDAVAELDWSVGQVLAKLRDLKLDDRTLVIFSSDNGPWYGGSAGGLRGMKGQTWEGGLRVPLIARWPGRIPAARVVAAPAIVMDVFPTVLAAAGVPAPADRTIDGRDLTGLLAADVAPPREALFFFAGDALRAVRSEKWKLHVAPPGPGRDKVWAPDEPWLDPRRPDGVRILAPFEQAHPSAFPGVRTGDPGAAGSLFDLDADAAEQKNVAAANPEVVRRLQALAERMKADLAKDGPPKAE